ncbi:hypothetical protein AVEN_24227-1 [Araneus ventricosus]|uniref:Reverse transcriptase domain-containing protein n=1 Tax=Araneus ventricosus TaxID=182803 RepID=A0A4Y2TWI8_ARAVE|nr:hypothetical protein AVEN_24227-1 [Araneus ventricosus]
MLEIGLGLSWVFTSSPIQSTWPKALFVIHRFKPIDFARRDGKHVLVLSIDIKGVFDNLQHRAILKTLDTSACSSNINRLFHSLLQNRKVTLLTPQGSATKEQKKGCPQGSCSGPALWNLIANEILNQVWSDNVHIQDFADDFVLVIKADANKSLVEDTQSAIT